jgi:hypothetical protein
VGYGFLKQCCSLTGALQQPELIVVSMKQDLAHYLLNEAARRMKQGLRLAGGHRGKELLENVECEFLKANPNGQNR